MSINPEETVSRLHITRMTLRRWPVQGWLGLLLVAIFWPLDWLAPGQRTLWAFFPLWLGFILTVDGLVAVRKGTSLFQRSRGKFAGLFLISVVCWWLFEFLNGRAHNWQYLGTGGLSLWAYLAFSSINFSIVIPAIFEASELASTFPFIRKARPGMVISGSYKNRLLFFAAGWVMLALLLAAPTYFFPFMWLSLFFIQEPINLVLGNRALSDWTGKGDWRPIYSLWVGVLMTGFFWEMWNFFSWPKWTYIIPGVDFLHIFEMPLLGYGGYLPFALELFALYHFLAGLFGRRRTEYVMELPKG